MARRFADLGGEVEAARCGTSRSSRHVVRPWRRIVRIGRDAIADLVESSSSDSRRRLQPGPGNPFDLSGSATPSGSSARRPDPAAFRSCRRQTMSALLAAQGQSVDGVDHLDIHSSTSDQPVRRAAGPVLADRRQRRRRNQQDGIRKRARRRRHQYRAGRQGVQRARQQWRRFGQPRAKCQSALKGAGGKGGHHHHAHAASSGDSAVNSADGTSSRPAVGFRQQRIEFRSIAAGVGRAHPATSVTNSDGSTTTSMTYADGSKVTMTLPAAQHHPPARHRAARRLPTISSSR